MRSSVISIILFFLAFHSLCAQEEYIQFEEFSDPFQIDSIAPAQPDQDHQLWSSVSIQGKLKMKGLPLSPSLKIFMQKDSLINISINAPFVGEAGRVVITPDSVTALNKMSKTYVNEGISDFLKYYPGNFSDVQDLLLARFFLPGVDLQNADLSQYIDVIFEDNQFNVVPKGDAIIPGIIYGYVVDANFRPQMMVVIPEERRDVEIDVLYSYPQSTQQPFSDEENPSISFPFDSLPDYPYNIQLIYQDGTRLSEVNLELKTPDWNATPPKPLELNNKFKKVSLSDFLRSF